MRAWFVTTLLSGGLLLVACGGGDDSESPATAGSGGTGSGTGGTVSSGANSSSSLPYSLDPIGTPEANTANVALYFTVTDANGEPVPGLETDDFVGREDGNELDVYESAFRAERAAGLLLVPTVLLLDLSRSVVQAGALEQVKSAALEVVENLGNTQRLAVVTFADEVNVRSCFGDSASDHAAAIESISDADGVSTNLYGALNNAYDMFQDGFYAPSLPSSSVSCYIGNSGSGDPSLIAGLVIVVSDGNDTAGRYTLDDAVNARDSRRTLFIRVGAELDASVAAELGNAGVIDAAGGFDDLDTAVGEAIDRTNRLNNAIYIAEYCSPKRAGSHELLFTVADNLPYLDGGGGSSTRCTPTGYGIGDPGEAICKYTTSTQYTYCSTDAPYWCESEGSCYPSESGAAASCGSDCRICGDEGSSSGTTDSGIAITMDFSADYFSDSQCDDLFNPPSGDGGASGTGRGGAGGDGGAGSFF